MKKTVAAAAAKDEWIPKADAAKRLGISIRQIENLTAKGRIRKRKMAKAAWEKTGRVVYASADIDAIRSGERPAVAQQVSQSPAAAMAVAVRAADPVAGLAAHLAHALGLPAPGKPWLTLQEAHEYSGLPARHLVESARAGMLRARNVGVKRERWMFPREGLS